MSAKQIIAEIDGLPEKRRQEVYDYVLQKTRRKEHALSVLEKIKGVGKGLWEKDAQEYVNELRTDDRI